MTEPQNRLSKLWTALREAESRHLTYAQLEAFADSRLESSEAELVRAHSELCRQCSTELRDLELFAKSMQAGETTVPERLSWWARMGHWLSRPQGAWVAVGTAAVLVITIIVVPRLKSPSPAPPVEAFLEAPSPSLGIAGSKQPPPAYRVLSRLEATAYLQELAKAPDDPETRAAIAIKYGLYSEAEKEYKKMEAAGGLQAEKAQRLIQQLERLRSR